MQLFIPDEHAFKVPEIRLPHECDSAAETKTEHLLQKMRSSESECQKPTLLFILSV